MFCEKNVVYLADNVQLIMRMRYGMTGVVILCVACSSGQFQCDNGQCIPWPKRCDVRVDCLDRSDERGCREWNLMTLTLRTFVLYDSRCVIDAGISYHYHSVVTELDADWILP